MLDRKREVQQPASLSATASRREIEREEEERVVTEEDEGAKGQRKRVGRALLLDVAPTPTGGNGMGRDEKGREE